ncbi:MAG: tRNA (adenosine(37)-N6)-threonylcarbamoyltransferase complex ATPase subunit type 1 TsaE [Deltaproteobacteria bacterium]|nr:tRNA (adenosine(37)-N6)-threonylcarbamoyltransferase complex ATPase subunit type 1 TsaE [Deltaproteobacteria bacterium]
MTVSPDSSDRLSFISPSPEKTRQVASVLSRCWAQTSHGRSGLQILLRGELGVGKTVFVKGLAMGLGLGSDHISSPTFVLANQYACEDGRGLHHVDFYRLESFDELESMGFFELGGPDVVLAIEWGDRFPEALSKDRLEIHLARRGSSGEEERAIEVQATGPESQLSLNAWKKNWPEKPLSSH